jgi:hypothetical protein
METPTPAGWLLAEYCSERGHNGMDPPFHLTSRRGKRSGRRRRRRKDLARYTTMLESFREGDLLKMLVFFL